MRNSIQSYSVLTAFISFAHLFWLCDADFTTFCPSYSVSYTYSATTNYVSCAIHNVCPGDYLFVDGCGSCSGDQFLNLYQSSQGVVANGNDGCGTYNGCAKFSYYVPTSGTSCRTYYLHQGCYDYFACAGAVTVTNFYGNWRESTPVSIPTPKPPTRLPTVKPTVIPTPVQTRTPTVKDVSSYDRHERSENACPYTASNTDSANQNVAHCYTSNLICPGDYIVFNGCGGCTGDQMFRLYANAWWDQRAFDDDGCGVGRCSLLSYTVPANEVCRTYHLAQGCYSNTACEGQLVFEHYYNVRVPSFAPTALPSVTPTRIPTTRQPTRTPTAIPTMKPTATPSVRPTAGPSIKPTVTPTIKPTGSPSVRPTFQPTSTSIPTRTPTVEDIAVYDKHERHENACAYTASNTDSANQNFAHCYTSNLICPGDYIVFNGCGGCTGDQMFRLYANEWWDQRAFNDDGCGVFGGCSLLSYIVPANEVCRTYHLAQGCFSNTACGGQLVFEHYYNVRVPSFAPTALPSVTPTRIPTTRQPTRTPTAIPTMKPTATPSVRPTAGPSIKPTVTPTNKPTSSPSAHLSGFPSVQPTMSPSHRLTVLPSVRPTANPITGIPSVNPTINPTCIPPTIKPTTAYPTQLYDTAPTTTTTVSTSPPSVLPTTTYHPTTGSFIVVPTATHAPSRNPSTIISVPPVGVIPSQMPTGTATPTVGIIVVENAIASKNSVDIWDLVLSKMILPAVVSFLSLLFAWIFKKQIAFQILRHCGFQITFQYGNSRNNKILKHQLGLALNADGKLCILPPDDDNDTRTDAEKAFVVIEQSDLNRETKRGLEADVVGLVVTELNTSQAERKTREMRNVLTRLQIYQIQRYALRTKRFKLGFFRYCVYYPAYKFFHRDYKKHCRKQPLDNTGKRTLSSCFMNKVSPHDDDSSDDDNSSVGGQNP